MNIFSLLKYSKVIQLFYSYDVADGEKERNNIK